MHGRNSTRPCGGQRSKRGAQRMHEGTGGGGRAAGARAVVVAARTDDLEELVQLLHLRAREGKDEIFSGSVARSLHERAHMNDERVQVKSK